MVDFNNISADFQGRIEKIMAGDGKDEKRIDSRNEYNQLAELLSGKNKPSGREKSCVEWLMTEYEEDFMVSRSVKERVLDIIKFGQFNMADDNAEIKELKDFKKTNGLTKEEKNWIQKIIEGRAVNIKSSERPTPNVNCVDSTISNSVTPTKPKETPNVSTEKDELQEPPNDTPKKCKPKESPNVLPKHENEPNFPKNDKTEPNKRPKAEHKLPVETPRGSEKLEKPRVDFPEPTIPSEPLPKLQPKNPVDEATPITPQEPTPVENKKGLTPVEISAARKNGEDVADRLFGYTSNTEQRTVQDIVENEINSGNVIEFIRGYEEKLKDETELNLKDFIVNGVIPGYSITKVNKDSFFEQMRTELDFPEKQELMHKVAQDLQNYLADKYGADSRIAKEVAVVLLERVFDQKEAEKLDKISKLELRL